MWRAALAREEGHLCVLARQLDATLALVPVDALRVAALLAEGPADATGFLLRLLARSACSRCLHYFFYLGKRLL